jgi:hypothetical protein
MAAARINQLRLRREMASRGWNACDLAQLCGIECSHSDGGLTGASGFTTNTAQDCSRDLANSCHS